MPDLIDVGDPMHKGFWVNFVSAKVYPGFLRA